MRLSSASSFASVIAMTAVLLPSSIACNAPSPSPASERTGATTSAIQGGQPATTQTFAVGVLGRGLCSGTLIAPNLVVTARHCVEVEPSSSISGCEDGKVVSPSEMAITTSPQFTESGPWVPVKRILTAPVTDKCEPDMALLQLAENVPDAKAKPARPAVDDAFAKRPHFSAKVTAVGYGVDDSGESGVRRIRENIPVLCVPGDDQFDCGTELAGYIQDFEIVADEGACQGDSGGGLYDQASIDAKAPVVVGVVSRGPVDEQTGKCLAGAYVRVDKFRSFIVDAARVAANEGGYPVPDWTADIPEPVADAGPPAVEAPPPEEPAPAAAPAATTTKTTTSGCTSAPSTTGSTSTALLAFGALVLSGAARRSRRDRPTARTSNSRRSP